MCIKIHPFQSKNGSPSHYFVSFGGRWCCCSRLLRWRSDRFKRLKIKERRGLCCEVYVRYVPYLSHTFHFFWSMYSLEPSLTYVSGIGWIYWVQCAQMVCPCVRTSCNNLWEDQAQPLWILTHDCGSHWFFFDKCKNSHQGRKKRTDIVGDIATKNNGIFDIDVVRVGNGLFDRQKNLYHLIHLAGKLLLERAGKHELPIGPELVNLIMKFSDAQDLYSCAQISTLLHTIAICWPMLVQLTEGDFKLFIESQWYCDASDCRSAGCCCSRTGPNPGVRFPEGEGRPAVHKKK